MSCRLEQSSAHVLLSRLSSSEIWWNSPIFMSLGTAWWITFGEVQDASTGTGRRGPRTSRMLRSERVWKGGSPPVDHIGHNILYIIYPYNRKYGFGVLDRPIGTKITLDCSFVWRRWRLSAWNVHGGQVGLARMFHCSTAAGACHGCKHCSQREQLPMCSTLQLANSQECGSNWPEHMTLQAARIDSETVLKPWATTSDFAALGSGLATLPTSPPQTCVMHMPSLLSSTSPYFT